MDAKSREGGRGSRAFIGDLRRLMRRLATATERVEVVRHVQTYSGHENKIRTLIEHSRSMEEPGEIAGREGDLGGARPDPGCGRDPQRQAGDGHQDGSTPATSSSDMMLERADSSIVINSIQSVIKFVGSGNRKPQPLREDEINKILGIEVETEETPGRSDIPFQRGTGGRGHAGPLHRLFSGTDSGDLSPTKGRSRVEVSLFGRPTSVEFDFTQLT